MSTEQQTTDERADKQDAARYRALKRHADTIFLLREVRLLKSGSPLYVTMIGPNELDEAMDSMEAIKVGDRRFVHIGDTPLEARIIGYDDEDDLWLVQFDDYSSRWVTEDRIQ